MAGAWCHTVDPGSVGSATALAELGSSVLRRPAVRELLAELGLPAVCVRDCGGDCARALAGEMADVLDQRQGRERWDIPHRQLLPAVGSRLDAVVDDLGLLDASAPSVDTAETLVVAGAGGLTALRRAEYGGRLADALAPRAIVVLSSDRILTDRERNLAGVPGARTEHDLMRAAAERYLAPTGVPVRSLRATGRAAGRATTEDTARLLFETETGRAGYLVVTTSLFVPFQHLVFLRCAGGPVTVETVGVAAATTGSRTDPASLLDAVYGVLREAVRVVLGARAVT